MLRIITGRIATGKTHKIIEEIGERIKNNKKSFLIVPDPVTYNFEQRLCRQLNINGFIDVEVCSFNRLASSILNYFGKNKKTYLDDCSKAMAVRIAVLKNEDKLTIFKSASHRKGFCERCLNMISIIENCGYTYEDLISVTERLDNGILKYKLNDMAVIYKAYTDILDRGYTDNADKLKTAEGLIKFYPEFKDAVIYIDGFDVLTSRLYSFFSELIKCTDVVIALSSDDTGLDKSYEIHKKTLEQIKSIAKENNCIFKEEKATNLKNFKSEEIHFLEDNFYIQNPRIYQKECKNITLCFYPNIDEEINEIAKKISLGVRSGNRYKDYAVICNDIKKYSPIINNVFKRYDIPVYTDKTHDITAHPVATYLFSLLKCVMYGFTEENVTAIALSSLTDLTCDERDSFISFIREAGVRPRELENGLIFKRGSEEKQAEFDLIRVKFIEPLKKFRETLLKAYTAREMASICYVYMEKAGIFEKIQALTDKYEEKELFTLSDITSQLWNKLIELLESFADLSGDDKLSVSQFHDTLFEGFKATPLSTIPSVLDSVTFGDLSATKEQNVPYVYIVGANDGVIPAVYDDERLVTKEESNILMEYGMELAHTEETEDARTRYTIYSAICSPIKSLEFSCPLFTPGGSLQRPSYIFKRLQTLFPLITKKNYKKIVPSEALKEPLSREQAMLDMARDKFNSPQAKALLKFMQGSNDRKFEILKNEAAEKEQNISPELASLLFSSDKTTSISQLEKYAACPFMHFIEYGLRPEEAREYSINSLDIGSALHTTLELFTKKSAQKQLTREECYRSASDIFDSLLPDIHFGAMLATERQQAFNNMLKNIACEGAWQIKQHIGNFTVIGEEISFGYGKYPPIEIKTELGTIYLKGKIDRADKLEKDGQVYLRIIDYKSGNKSFSEKELLEGTNIQLAIYMTALINAYKDSIPASAQYMSITDNKFSGPELLEFNEKGVTHEHFNYLLTSAVDVAKNLSENMLKGNIETKNTDCSYCKYSAVCRIKHKEETKDA